MSRRLDLFLASLRFLLKRKWFIVLIGSTIVCLLAMGMYIIESQRPKSTTIVLHVDGKSLTVDTQSTTVEDMLQNEMIPLNKRDYISVPLQTVIEEGLNIEIRYAKNFTITSKGQTTSYSSTAKSIEMALEDVGVVLSHEDETSPPRTSTLVEDDDIMILNYITNMEKTVEDQPIKTITIYDDTLLKGQSRIAQKGSPPTLEKQVQQKYLNGYALNEKPDESIIKTEGVPQIVVVGTKEPKPVYVEPSIEAQLIQDDSSVIKKESSTSTTLKNEQLNQEQSIVPYDGESEEILTGFELTAYTAHFASTGKHEGDKDYGVTATGTKVMEGRTIAVDPSVIPLGWWVYIDGLGYRKAEDVGGAIKGKKIDVYFDNEEYAKFFGRKHGYTVTIIGPNKPDELS